MEPYRLVSMVLASLFNGREPVLAIALGLLIALQLVFSNPDWMLTELVKAITLLMLVAA